MRQTKIVFKKGIKRINIAVREYEVYKAIRKVEQMKLPKHRAIGYEIIIYKGKDGFEGIPNVFILK